MSVVQANDFRDDSDKIFHLKRAVRGIIWRIETKALINLVATNAAIIVALVIKEGTLNKLAGILDGREIAWAKTLKDFKKRSRLRIGWIFFKRIFDVMDFPSINIFEILEDFTLLATKRTKKRCYWNFFAAVDLNIDDTFRIGFKLKPRATAWDDFRTIIFMVVDGVCLEKYTRRTNQLRNNHTLGAFDDEVSLVGHFRIVTKIDVLLFDFASNFVG